MQDSETNEGKMQGPESHTVSRKEGGTARSKRVPRAVKISVALLLVLIAAGAAAWAWISSLGAEMSLGAEELNELEDVLVDPVRSEQQEAFYTLIIGSDSRGDGAASRSDTIILARVDIAAARITLVSIPRDTMVYGEDGSLEKINAAYNDGPASTVRAVSEFAGVDIAHYIEVDFRGLEQIVDALGGVRVTIPEDISAGNGGMAFSAGEQVLTGEQAFAYARERYTVSGGDFGRARAQRQIAEAIINQVLASGPTEIPALITMFAQSIGTDLAPADIISYALSLQGSGQPLTTYSTVAPSYALNQDGVSYVATMYDEWRAVMQRVDAGLDPSDASVAVPAEQIANERLGSAANAAGPRDYAGLAAGSGLTTADAR